MNISTEAKWRKKRKQLARVQSLPFVRSVAKSLRNRLQKEKGYEAVFVMGLVNIGFTDGVQAKHGSFPEQI